MNKVIQGYWGSHEDSKHPEVTLVYKTLILILPLLDPLRT